MLAQLNKLALAALLLLGGSGACLAVSHSALAEESIDEASSVEVADVPVLSQFPELPTGCEATAATMLLQWGGVEVSKEEIAAAIPRQPMPEWSVTEDGEETALMLGANPNEVFVGDPESVGFGVYHKPVADVINLFLPERVKDLSGISFEGLLEAMKENQAPAVVWATVDMTELELFAEWTDPYGGVVQWYEPEHAMTLVGFDDDYVYVNDPYRGQQSAYERELFRDRWERMGSQAVTVGRASAPAEQADQQEWISDHP